MIRRKERKWSINIYLKDSEEGRKNEIERARERERAYSRASGGKYSFLEK